MNHVIDAVLLQEDLTPQEREVLWRLLSDDTGLAETFATWGRIQDHLRDQLNREVPDRGLLVCYALEKAGRHDLLAEDERRMLGAALPALERALVRHPGLADVVRRIQGDADAFEQIWNEHLGDALPALNRTDRRPVRHSSCRTATPKRWVWRIGSVAAVVAFALIVMFLIQRDSGMVAVQTAAGEVRMIELPEGSRIRLMGGSSLSYDGAEERTAFRRHVRLAGRAFFEIAPDEQPFTVETPTALATVLGTSFGIAATDDMMEVVLASGRLGVAPAAAPDQMVVLDEGEMSRVSRGALPSTPAPVDVAEQLEWTGLFIFRATPARDIVGQLGRRYGIDVAVSPALQEEPVTGTFEQAQGAEQILEAVAATLGASVETDEGGGYVIR